MVLDIRPITIRVGAHDVGTTFGSCQAIFMDVLDIRHAAAKIVPKLLNFEQKTSYGHRLGGVDDVQRRRRFAQNVHN